MHFGLSSQSYDMSKIGEPLFGAKVAYFEANLRVGSQFCSLLGQKRSKSKSFFPPEPDFAGLMIAKNTFLIQPFWSKLLRFNVALKSATLEELFFVKCEPVGKKHGGILQREWSLTAVFVVKLTAEGRTSQASVFRCFPRQSSTTFSLTLPGSMNI